jgi:DNA end-binding protein Ku
MQYFEARSVAWKNDYEAAVKKLVDAKRKGSRCPTEQEPAKTKVVNIMDPLGSSLTQG